MEIRGWVQECLARDELGQRDIGRAWATVDLERALEQIGRPDFRWKSVRDQLIGARGVRLMGSAPILIVLEPSTEGRLAGWLARNGEGEAVVYRSGPVGARARTANTAIGSVGALGSSASGLPLLVLVPVR